MNFLGDFAIFFQKLQNCFHNSNRYDSVSIGELSGCFCNFFQKIAKMLLQFKQIWFCQYRWVYIPNIMGYTIRTRPTLWGSLNYGVLIWVPHNFVLKTSFIVIRGMLEHFCKIPHNDDLHPLKYPTMILLLLCQQLSFVLKQTSIRVKKATVWG